MIFAFACARRIRDLHQDDKRIFGNVRDLFSGTLLPHPDPIIVTFRPQ
jgi:hypothetical protein